MQTRTVRVSVVVLVMVTAAASWAEPNRAIIGKLTGKVEIQRGGAGWEPATLGLELAEGDKLHTGYKSTAALGFPDGSVVEVQPMTLIGVDKVSLSGPNTRSRILLKLGEVKAQIQRVVGAAGDFQVRTPTTTASVRGTEIHRISYDEGAGMQVRMGSHGLLAVLTPQGQAFLAANRSTGIRQRGDSPIPPAMWDWGQQSVDLLPQGSTTGERADVRYLGVPKLAPDGGSTLADRVARRPEAETVVIAPPQMPPPIQQPSTPPPPPPTVPTLEPPVVRNPDPAPSIPVTQPPVTSPPPPTAPINISPGRQ